MCRPEGGGGTLAQCLMQRVALKRCRSAWAGLSRFLLHSRETETRNYILKTWICGEGSSETYLAPLCKLHLLLWGLSEGCSSRYPWNSPSLCLVHRAWPAALRSGRVHVGVVIGSRTLGWWLLVFLMRERGRSPQEHEEDAVGDLQRVWAVGMDLGVQVFQGA